MVIESDNILEISSLTARFSHVSLLPQITLYPSGPFGSMVGLRGADEEASFFHNIRHIQVTMVVRLVVWWSPLKIVIEHLNMLTWVIALYSTVTEPG